VHLARGVPGELAVREARDGVVEQARQVERGRLGFSESMRSAPSAARRRPKGSLSPVGCWPTPQIPTRVSSLSASATAMLTSPDGSWSPANRGQ